MIRHEKIRTVIDDKETREFLKGLFEKNMSEGTDRTSILRFCETLTDILRDEVGIVKGKRQTSVVSDTWKDEIKNRRAGCDRHEEIRLSEVSHHRGVDSTPHRDGDIREDHRTRHAP